MLQDDCNTAAREQEDASSESKSCSYCDAVLKSRDALDDHLFHKHQRLLCCICDSALKGKGSYHNHVTKVHHKKKGYECCLCMLVPRSKFVWASQLEQHQKAYHPNDEIIWCDFAGKYTTKPDTP